MVTQAVEALFAEESLKGKPVDAFAEVLGSVEALVTEELEIKPVEAFAEVSFEVKPRDDEPAPSTHRPAWWPRDDNLSTSLLMQGRCLIPGTCLMMT